MICYARKLRFVYTQYPSEPKKGLHRKLAGSQPSKADKHVKILKTYVKLLDTWFLKLDSNSFVFFYDADFESLH